MVKCPDCGAPQGTAVPARRTSSKASTIGLLLVVSFLLGTIQGFYIVLQPDIAPNQWGIYGVSFPVHGTVQDENGTPLADVNVTHGDASTRTDANGSYAFADVSPGVVDFLFAAEGHANVTVRFFLQRAETIDAQLPASGAEAPRIDHPTYENLRIIFQSCGVIVLGCSLLALLGGIAAYRRRSWGLVLAGAIAALFVSPPISPLVGALAIFLAVRARAEFTRLP